MPDLRHLFASKTPIGARPLLVALTALTATATAYAQPLTADETVRLALENADNRIVIDAPVDRAAGQVRSARTWRNPELSVEREGADGFGGDGSETFVQVEREFDLSGRRNLQALGAEADLEAARFGRRVGRADLRAEAEAAFYALLASDAERQALAGFAEQLSELQTATHRRVDAGDASQLELERVRQETLRLPALQAETRLAVERAQDELYILTGVDTRILEGLSGTLLPEVRDISGASAAAASPRLQMLEAEAAAAGAREDAASRVTPDVTLGVGVRHTEGMGGETGLLVTASAPLPLFDRNEGERQSAEADARMAEARVRVERRRLQADAERLRRRAAAFHATASGYQAEALTSAVELRRIALVSYAGGEIGVLEAIDAIRTAYEAEVHAITLQRQARQATIALHQLLAETE